MLSNVDKGTPKIKIKSPGSTIICECVTALKLILLLANASAILIYFKNVKLSMSEFDFVRIVGKTGRPRPPIYLDLTKNGIFGGEGGILKLSQARLGGGMTAELSPNGLLVGNSENASIHLYGSNGNIVLRDVQGTRSFEVRTGDANTGASLWIGNNDDPVNRRKSGLLTVRDGFGHDSIVLAGDGGNVWVVDKNGIPSFSFISGDANTGAQLWIGAKKDDTPRNVPKSGFVALRNEAGEESIILNGMTGDITLQKADCAEEFDISPSDFSPIEPGVVMVIDNDGRLQISSKPYDRGVAGVISGAGNLKPGIVFNRQKSRDLRAPLAMLGKVFCKVDADQCPIKVGDMLTTSNTQGHAMKATNRSKAFGSVIGKALQSLKQGKNMIPILVALQ